MPDCIDKLRLAVVARVSSEDGQTMVEYGLLAVFIAIAVLAGAQLLGTNLLAFFNSFANTL
jgi:pilus assembly protein Flp/PilA